ncbi:MAG TPA: YbhN family protein [Solirubrobacteraceae bacterium]|nr:YbhN family protein [Solirubrobacteraceae bacterium]
MSLRLKLRGDSRVDEIKRITEQLNRPPASGSVTRSAWRRYAKPIALLAVAGASLYLFLPSLIAVFSSWHSLTHLDWPFAVLVVVCEIASFLWLWQLDRIALHTRAWFPVAAAQLSGNAVGRIVPGGGATATAFTASMLRRAGVDTGEAAAAFGASTGLQLATTLALPVLALPAIIAGAPVSHSLATAAYLGIALLVVLLAAGAAAFLTDAPLKIAGAAIQWLLNATIRRRQRVTQLPQELLEDRDFIRTTIGERWRGAVVAAALNTGFDYLALLCALRAVGADPRPSLVLLAYTAGELLALVPFTPGGLGFVEAGLVGTLALAGVPGRDALAATLLYRLAAYWLPIPAGGLAYVLFRRRYDPSRGNATAVRDSSD